MRLLYIDLTTQELQRLITMFPASLSRSDQILYNKIVKTLEREKNKCKYDFEALGNYHLYELFHLPERLLLLDIKDFFQPFEGKIYRTITSYLKRNNCLYMKDLMDLTVSKLGCIRYMANSGRVAIF